MLNLSLRWCYFLPSSALEVHVRKYQVYLVWLWELSSASFRSASDRGWLATQILFLNIFWPAFPCVHVSCSLRYRFCTCPPRGIYLGWETAVGLKYFFSLELWAAKPTPGLSDSFLWWMEGEEGPSCCSISWRVQLTSFQLSLFILSSFWVLRLMEMRPRHLKLMGLIWFFPPFGLKHNSSHSYSL